MSNFRRRLMMNIKKNKLPSGYTECEYIESTGTQYIDTGVIPNIMPKIEIRCALKGFSNADLCGTSNKQSNSFTLNVDENNAFKLWFWNKTSWLKFNTIKPMSEMTTIYVGEVFTQDGIHIADIPQDIDYSELATSLTLCAGRNRTRKSKVKIEFCKIWDGDRLERDYIPCYRKSDGEIGMYDTITEQFYTNQGTGVFLKGPDE